MKIGMSTYSLKGAFTDGRLDLPGIVRTAAEWGAEHVEVMPMSADLLASPDIRKAVKAEAAKSGIELSCYTFAANFLTAKIDGQDLSEAGRRAEIERVKKHIDVAAELGVKFVRHDVGCRPQGPSTPKQFELDLPVAADACREIADYAVQYGIVTNVENHGRYFQGSERVHRLVDAVARPNFRCIIDIANFCVADEDPYSGTMNNLDIVSMFHLKDSYRRTRVPDPQKWGRTNHGDYILGAIVGYGDIDLERIAGLIKSSGFDGFVSVEYGSLADCLLGAKRSLECARALFAEQ